MTIGVPRETEADETRVAVSPTSVAQYKKQGFAVLVEAGAGAKAKFLDKDYADAGATIVPTAADACIPSRISRCATRPGCSKSSATSSARVCASR